MKSNMFAMFLFSFLSGSFALALDLTTELHSALAHASVTASPVYGHCAFATSKSNISDGPEAFCKTIAKNSSTGTAQCAMNKAISNCQTMYGKCGSLLNRTLGDALHDEITTQGLIDGDQFICKISAFVYGQDPRSQDVSQSQKEWRQVVQNYFAKLQIPATSFESFQQASQVFRNLPIYRNKKGAPIMGSLDGGMIDAEYYYHLLLDQKEGRTLTCGLDTMTITQSRMYLAPTPLGKPTATYHSNLMDESLRAYYAACIVGDAGMVIESINALQATTTDFLRVVYAKTGVKIDFKTTFPTSPEMIYWRF